MSALGSRVSMTHRCTILRNAGASNSWGGKDAAWQTHLSDQPCRAWYVNESPLVAPAEVVAVGTYRLALPAGTDVTVDDRVGPVTLRGATVMPGPYYRIDNIVHWPDWVELVLRVSG